MKTYEQMRSKVDRISDAEIKDRVLAGLELLQQKHGDAWVEKIDCKSLDLASEACCVLGQVYADPDAHWDPMGLSASPYATGIRDLDISGRGYLYGFDILPDEDHDSYAELQEAWQAVIC